MSQERDNTKARRIYEKHMGWKIPKHYHIHHLIPVQLGGTDDVDNLLLMHPKDHAKVTLCFQKNFPTNDEILEASKALKHWMNVKESKIIPEPLDSDDHELSENQKFMIEHKDELHIIKIVKRLSNPEMVEYEPFKDNLGCEDTFRKNRIKLGWNEVIWDDRLNGIFNEKQSKAKKGKTAHNKGKPWSEESIMKRSETVKQKRKAERLLRYIGWRRAKHENPKLTQKQFAKEEGISANTLNRTINEFKLSSNFEALRFKVLNMINSPNAPRRA